MSQLYEALPHYCSLRQEMEQDIKSFGQYYNKSNKRKHNNIKSKKRK